VCRATHADAAGALSRGAVRGAGGPAVPHSTCENPPHWQQNEGHPTASEPGRLRKQEGVWSAFCIKMIPLPRQARDKHRASTQKKTVFLTAQAAESPVAAIVTAAASSGGSYGGLGEYRPRGLRLR
jgi:hypothetical protein